MLRYLLRRLIVMGLSLLAASALIFSIMGLVPGDPASFMLGTGAQPETVAALRQQLGLDQPFALRYAAWLGAILHGDFGTSFTYKTPVGGMILDRLQVSLPLAVLALMLAGLLQILSWQKKPVTFICLKRHRPQRMAP